MQMPEARAQQECLPLTCALRPVLNNDAHEDAHANENADGHEKTCAHGTDDLDARARLCAHARDDARVRDCDHEDGDS